jgi:hypothetical protein
VLGCVGVCGGVGVLLRGGCVFGVCGWVCGWWVGCV